jgi:7SK snRNA methylphosphate capping enzyme
MEAPAAGKGGSAPGLGNYKGYYSQRPDSSDRLKVMKKEWFANKNCLDIGCNSGHLTFRIAEKFTPRSILGIDVDCALIDRARARLTHTPIAPVAIASSSLVPRAVRLKLEQKVAFPLNLSFKHCDILSGARELVGTRSFDTVMCCSVSKWIHLNHGDDGLILFFQSMFDLLSPGGHAILEYQPWLSYERNRKSSETTKSVFPTITIRPEQFEEVLEKTIGFRIVSRLGTPLGEAKGFNRPILILMKPITAPLLLTKPVSTSGPSRTNEETITISSAEHDSDKSSSRKRKRKDESLESESIESQVLPDDEEMSEGEKKKKKKEKKEKKKNKEKKRSNNSSEC